MFILEQDGRVHAWVVTHQAVTVFRREKLRSAVLDRTHVAHLTKAA
jgi:hypothetical protein